VTPRAPRAAALFAVLSLIAPAGCTRPQFVASPPATPAPTTPVRIEPTTPAALPTATPRPSTGPTARPRPSRSTTPSPTPPVLTLADYLARIPKFPAGPTPVPVTLTHADEHSAFAYQISTTQPVAFLTIDDGIVREPDAVALMRAAKVPVTLFLTTNIIAADPGYFRQLQGLGAVIEDHTVSHPHLPTLSYDAQKAQLCEAADRLAEWFGRRPLFFRPPYGEYNDDTLRAGWACGLVAGFHWRETVNAGIVRYQRSDHTIHAGDIILMHFRSTFDADFVAALQAIHAAGLTPALLEEYVKVAE
jgi:peptidoglycan/xylan/chitin deacetylase (PgdA/CDA1 family)